MAKEFTFHSTGQTPPRQRKFTSLSDKLADKGYDSEQYLKAIAARMNDDILAEFQEERREIMVVADDTSQKLKQNVYKNYTRWANVVKMVFVIAIGSAAFEAPSSIITLV